MQQNYDACLKRVLAHEGGYCNDAGDPGGPTNFGITIIDYRKYVKPNATAADVWAMKLDEAKAIYRAKYWDAQNCDALPGGVDYSVFDYGVNSGIGRSGKVLRRVIGLPDDDWHTTPAVLAALAKRDPKAVIAAINDERLRFLKGLRTWSRFGGGWGRRVAEVRAFSLQLAGHPINVALPQMPVTGKGLHAAPPSVAKITAAGGGTAAVAGGGFAHWVGAHLIETAFVAAVLVIGVGGVATWMYARHAAKQEAPTPNTPFVPEIKAA